MASNAPAYLAVAASFLAAGLSGLNVALSARYARRGDLERWRRETLLPILVGFLDATDNLLRVAQSLDEPEFITSPAEEQDRLHRDFTRATRSLNASWTSVELVARSDLKTTGDRLRLALMELPITTALRLLGGDLPAPDFDATDQLRQRFVEAAKGSLGVPLR